MRSTFKIGLAVIALISGALSVAGAKSTQTTSRTPAATQSSSGSHEFVIDRSHSEVGFNVRHFFSKVHGSFDDFSGTIVYDAKNLPLSTVEVTIRDSSISTGNDRRDKHLRTEDFFWTETYPTIKFKSTKVVPSEGPSHFQVQGDLTIRDVTKPVTLEAELIGMGPVTIEGRDMGTRAGFSARTTINRKDFGIVWNKTVDQGGVMLGDDVELVLNVEAFTKPEVSALATPKPATTDKK